MPVLSRPALRRFVITHEMFHKILREVKEETTNWAHYASFIFPQLIKLGRSSQDKFGGIHGIEEARAYLAHPLLGARLRECCKLLLQHQGRPIGQIAGARGTTTIAASMTLFSQAGGPKETIFREVLLHFYQGKEDEYTLRVLRSGPGPVVLLTDYAQMQWVVQILVNNAVHAIGGKAGRIDVRLEVIDAASDPARQRLRLGDGKLVRLSVRDNGCGMDHATLGQLFEPFPVTESRMGLATVCGFVQRNDGAISVHSELGQGATFQVYLPVCDPSWSPPEPDFSATMIGRLEPIAVELIPLIHEAIEDLRPTLPANIEIAFCH